MPDEAGLRNLLAVFIVHGVIAPRAVIVGRGECTGGIQQRNDVALRVEDVVSVRAILRDAADVARYTASAAAQRDAAGNDDDLWLCADGCTHHSDHLSIFLRAVQYTARLQLMLLLILSLFRVIRWFQRFFLPLLLTLIFRGFFPIGPQEIKFNANNAGPNEQ